MGRMTDGWLNDVLTGPDNQTVAIGRMLSLLIAAVLLIGLPVTAVATVMTGFTGIETWRVLFDALGLYVPLVVGAITGLIWGTNPTEPKSSNAQGHDNG